MPPRRGGRRGAAEPEDRVDRIERILEGLVQMVHDVHNHNNNAHDDAPQQPAMQMPEAGAMPRATIKQFQQLRPPTFYGTSDPMAAESWLLGIERIFEVLPCAEEQKVVFATFTFEGAALMWWQLKKPLEQVWLWPRFLEVFNASARVGYTLDVTRGDEVWNSSQVWYMPFDDMNDPVTDRKSTRLNSSH